MEPLSAYSRVKVHDAPPLKSEISLVRGFDLLDIFRCNAPDFFLWYLFKFHFYKVEAEPFCLGAA